MQECRETLVGDDVIRGVSGGQKKRVSTGESTYVLDKHHPQSTICHSAMQAGSKNLLYPAIWHCAA